MVAVDRNNLNSLQSTVQGFVSSLEAAYRDIGECRSKIADNNPTAYSLVHRVHELERRACGLLERSGRLNQVMEGKKALLRGIVDENTELCRQVQEKSRVRTKASKGHL